MEPSGVSQAHRPWAGEGLWNGQPAVSRSVEVVSSEKGCFKAIGQAARKTAFEVSLRPEQLWRFRRAMERAGAIVQGLPPWTEPDSKEGHPPRPRRGPIGTSASDKPPPTPIQTAPSSPSADSKPLLLLSAADERRPALPPEAVGLDAIARVPRLVDRLPRPEHLGDTGGNPNSLSRQGWGVIAPRGTAGDELLEAIRPLMDLRAEQQGVPVRTYRVGAMGSMVEVNEWVRTTYLSEKVLEEDRPRYLLILGDLADVSAELQQRLGASAWIGRLCFDDLAGYRAYVEKLVRHEKAPPKEDARALFFTTHDGSPATDVGYDSLVTPALEMCDAVSRRAYPVREVLEVGSPEDWSAERLLEAVRESGPGVLFTLSHGLGPPRGGWSSSGQRRLLQGAMAFGDGEPLAADRVARGPFMPCGAWFFLACLSAGTPSKSVYRPWLERLKAAGEHSGRLDSVLAALPPAGEPPFIAALPRAALSNPEGPLAIIGHLDLAWTYSFKDAYGARRPARFVEVVKQLWTGRRVGVAMRELLRYASETEGELMGLAQADAELEQGAQPPPDLVHRGHLWMARNDLAGYLLLGDPAARVAPARD